MIMNNKIVLIILVIPVVFILTTSVIVKGQEADNGLSLMGAVEIALKTDDGLLATEQNSRAADTGIKSAKGAYWPSLAATGSYSHVTRTNEISLDIPVVGRRNIKITPDNPFDANLALSWDVYTFGRRGALVEIARQESESSHLSYSQAKKRLFDSVAHAYLTTVFAKMNLDLAQNERERVSKIYQLVEEKYNQQLTPEFDLLQAQLRLRQYDLKELSLSNNLEMARLNLARAIKAEVDTLPPLTDTLNESYFSLPDFDSSYINVENREDYRQAQARIESSRLARQVQKSAYFPNVSVFSVYDWRNGYQPDLAKVEGNLSIGVNLNWLLFDGFTRRAELSKQGHIWKAAQYRADDIKTLIPVQAQGARLALQNSDSSVAVARKSLEVAQKAMTIAETRYKIGDISMIDYLDTENKLAAAEQELLQLRYRLILAQLDLKAVLSYYPELDRLN